jgi:hypothetical protein
MDKGMLTHRYQDAHPKAFPRQPGNYRGIISRMLAHVTRAMVLLLSTTESLKRIGYLHCFTDAPKFWMQNARTLQGTLYTPALCSSPATRPFHADMHMSSPWARGQTEHWPVRSFGVTCWRWLWGGIARNSERAGGEYHAQRGGLRCDAEANRRFVEREKESMQWGPRHFLEVLSWSRRLSERSLSVFRQGSGEWFGRSNDKTSMSDEH